VADKRTERRERKLEGQKGGVVIQNQLNPGPTSARERKIREVYLLYP